MGSTALPQQGWASDVPRDGLGLFVSQVPKAELHVHIEGTMEPGTLARIAERNGVLPRLAEREGLEAGCSAQAYAAHVRQCRESYADLGDFLRLYNAATEALRTQQDFDDLMQGYIDRAVENNIVYAEIFFDPQTHLSQGVSMATVVNGLYAPLQRAAAAAGGGRPVFRGHLIASLLRDFKITKDDDREGSPSADETLDMLKPFVQEGKVLALGMSNHELHTTPSKFREMFEKARGEVGLKHTVSHAGEEGSPDPYLKEAITVLGVERVDHGVMCLHDQDTIDLIKERGLALTVCPTSNIVLRIYERFFDSKSDVLRRLMDHGVLTTINSDDPAYFGGYLSLVFYITTLTNKLSAAEVIASCEQAFDSAFLPDDDKRAYKEMLWNFVDSTAAGATRADCLRVCEQRAADTSQQSDLPLQLKQHIGLH